MNIPGFDAETSLDPTIDRYLRNAVFGSSQTGGISPTPAFFGGSGRLGQVKKCCEWDPFWKRFMCSSKIVQPGQDCRCVGKFILCRDPVLSTF